MTEYNKQQKYTISGKPWNVNFHTSIFVTTFAHTKARFIYNIAAVIAIPIKICDTVAGFPKKKKFVKGHDV